MEDLRAIIETLLFASDTPLGVDRIRDILGEAERTEIAQVIADLKREHDERKGGFQLCEVASGYQFRTRPDLALWIKKMRGLKPSMLSPAALETLAVIAYRQPVVKADIDRVRGVDVSGTLKGLLEKKTGQDAGAQGCPREAHRVRYVEEVSRGLQSQGSVGTSHAA